MYNKKLWIIVIFLFSFLIFITIYAATNPNKPVTYILETYMDKEQISKFNEICSTCDISVKKINRDESLDGLDGENSLGFRIEPQYRGTVILYIKDGSVKSLRFADNYLYNDGNYISSLYEYLK